MFVPPARHRQPTSPVTLENLEPRLLLTTLTIGGDGLDQIFI